MKKTFAFKLYTNKKNKKLIEQIEIKVDAPLFFKEGSKAVKKANNALSTKKRGSNNGKKARLHLARVHKKIACQRRDYHVKLAQQLTKEHDSLFFEDLYVKGMQSLWGKKINDLGFGNFLQHVEHYAKRNGAQVHYIQRFYPSSKTCHVCQKVFEELSLNDRVWRCSGCNTLHDRDVNSAINIKIVGASTIGLGDVRPVYTGNRCSNPESNEL